jgi:ribosomal protein RSM22 (predicted rRNA methylase)
MLHCPVIPPNGIDLEKCNCNVFIEINFESLSRKLVERKYCFKKNESKREISRIFGRQPKLMS